MTLNNVRYRKIFRLLWLGFLFFYPHAAYPEVKQGLKTWVDVFISGNLWNHPKLLYSLALQNRIDLQKPGYERGLVSGGMGYQFLSYLSLWAGYQWNSENLITGTSPENRIWQQALSEFNNHAIDVSSRTRLEERKPVDNAEWGYRLREKVTLKFPKKLFATLTPVLYDEVFLNLSHPSWVNNEFLSENRVLAGIDIPLSKRIYFETGYLNQYQLTTTGNRMNHVLYFSFYITT